MQIDLIRYAPVKINPDPPTLGYVGLWWSFITILAALWVPGMWGICTFCRFCPEECGALEGDIRSNCDRSRKD